jgi:catechol 2,3-dioxygenase-like lactoylglutathione lyase family enzyme
MPDSDALALGFPRWVGVVCEDLEGQRRFYRDVLGMPVTAEGDGWIKFDLGQGPTFELVQRSSEPEYDQTRYQVGFTVQNIEAARSSMLARGVTPVSEILGSPDGARWAYFRDPEGNVFEITERPAAG